MAQIITYPKLSTLANNDLLLVSDVSSPNKITNSLEIDTLAQHIIITNSVIKGGGTVNKLAMFTPTGTSIGDSFIRQDDPATGGTVYITPTDLGASGDFQFGTGGSFSSLPAVDGYEFRKQNGGFYKKTFKFESKEGISIGRSSISGNVTLDVGDASDTKPAAWFRNGVVLSNNPGAVQVDNTSMIIGAGNNDIISGSDNCLAVGNNNQIQNDSDHSLAVGQGNTMDNADNSIVVGQRNNLTGTRLYVLGFDNAINCASSFAMGGDNGVEGTQNQFAIGYNHNLGTPGGAEQKQIAIGTANSLQGTNVDQGIAIGNNLTADVTSNYQTGILLLGKNNTNTRYDVGPFNINPAVIISGGTGVSSDAIIVTNSGGNISQVVLPEVYANNNYLNDGQAALGGVPIGGIYHNAGELRIRIV